VTGFNWKILIVGDGAVGKTTLFQRIKTGSYNENTIMTIGVDFYTFELKQEENRIRLQIWDLGGQPQFKKLLPAYRGGTNAAIVMYDLTRYSTVQHLEEWISFIREENATIPILIVGSKLDLAEKICVKEADLESYLKRFAFGHCRCSSKTGTGIEDILGLMANATLKYMKEKSIHLVMH
jgi:small GTP-binding protein